MENEHWSASAERVYPADEVTEYAWWFWLLGEDENGDWWVPSLTDRGLWTSRFTASKPWHWYPWFMSFVTNKIVWL